MSEHKPVVTDRDDSSGGLLLNTRTLLLIVALTGGAPVVGQVVSRVGDNKPVLAEIPAEVRADIAAAKTAGETAARKLGDIEVSLGVIKSERDGLKVTVSDHEARLRAIEKRLK